MIEEQLVLVVGSGSSGSAAAELLQSKNVDTVFFDGSKEQDLNQLYEKAPELKDMKINHFIDPIEFGDKDN